MLGENVPGRTWGVVMRTVTSPRTEMWFAVDVRSVAGTMEAAARSLPERIERSPSAFSAVFAVARHLTDGGSLRFARIETPAEYRAHLNQMRLVLAIDRVTQLEARIVEVETSLDQYTTAYFRAREEADEARGTKAALDHARDEITRLWRAINAAQVEIGKRADACHELGDIGNARPKAQAYERAERIIVEELQAERLDITLHQENRNAS